MPNQIMEKTIESNIAHCESCGPRIGILTLFLSPPVLGSLQGDAKGYIKCMNCKGLTYVSYLEVLAICPAMVNLSRLAQVPISFAFRGVESGNWSILD